MQVQAVLVLGVKPVKVVVEVQPVLVLAVKPVKEPDVSGKEDKLQIRPTSYCLANMPCAIHLAWVALLRSTGNSLPILKCA